MIPIGAPYSFVRGTTQAYRVRPGNDYPPATWTLNVTFITTDDQQTITATDNGDGTFLVTIDRAASLLFREGNYRFQEVVDNGTDFELLDAGVVVVLPNFAELSSGHDGRSHAAKMYDKLSELLEAKADDDKNSMSQQDMSLSRYQFADLQEQRGHYAHAMTDDERVARGFKPRRARATRFCR